MPVDFWDQARVALDSIKTIMMLSEGAYPEHHFKAFDITYDWDLYHAISPVLSGTTTARSLDRVLNVQELSYPKRALHLRFSSNHDENAWDKTDVEKFGVTGAKLAAVLVNTVPGIPLLYNGQEVGNPIRLKLFEKIPIQWNVTNDFRSFYTTLYDIRKAHPALTGQTMIRVPSSDDRRVYAFLRIAPQDTVLVICNFGSMPFYGTLQLLEIGSRLDSIVVLTDLFAGTSATASMTADKTLSVSVPEVGYSLFQISTLAKK